MLLQPEQSVSLWLTSLTLTLWPHPPVGKSQLHLHVKKPKYTGRSPLQRRQEERQPSPPRGSLALQGTAFWTSWSISDFPAAHGHCPYRPHQHHLSFCTNYTLMITTVKSTFHPYMETATTLHPYMETTLWLYELMVMAGVVRVDIFQSVKCKTIMDSDVVTLDTCVHWIGFWLLGSQHL